MSVKTYRRLESTGIYVDTYELMKSVYQLLYSFPKKDRVVMGDRLMSLVTTMFSEFAMAYKVRRDRLLHIDNFLVAFESFKGLLRICGDLKIVAVNRRTQLYIYIERIDEGIVKWRESVASQVQAAAASNNGRHTGIQETRGGDGIIHTSSGSAP